MPARASSLLSTKSSSQKKGLRSSLFTLGMGALPPTAVGAVKRKFWVWPVLFGENVGIAVRRELDPL